MAGVGVNDRQKGSKARSLILDEVIRIFERDPVTLSEGEVALKRDLLLRMAPNTLPRLHEVTGEDGEPVKYQLVSYDNNQGTIPSESIPAAITESV